MAKWNKNYDHIQLIRELEKTRSINKEGRAQFSGFGMMTKCPKLEAMIILNQEITLEDKHSIVQQSIFNAGRKGKLTPEAILPEVKKLEGEHLSSKEQSYVLVTSISVGRNYHKLPNLQIDKNRITFSKSLPKRFVNTINKQRKQFMYYSEKKKTPSNYLFVRITVRAKGIHRATEKALNALNFYRGLLNYTINYGQQTFSFGGMHRTPINKILLGQTHTLHKTNGSMAVDDLYWYEEGYREPVRVYKDNAVGRFAKMLKYVGEIRKNIQKSKIREKLQYAILLYTDALDSYDYEISYIKLWALLELLTATGKDDNHKVTVRRTSFIFNKPEVERVHLELLKNFRNDLVHKGHMNAKLEIFVYDLKLYVEILLHFLIFNSSRFSSMSDISYLLDRSINSKDLKKKAGLDNFAIKLNKTRKK